ncbi:WS/DGAT/MGAT family O-acyltransferase [Nocardioides mesophilus]|uniref:Diacylglycerol O-acyltransferase n=1 Tax=Nocardioides mesophilus TaxID=433659 RepID=A0A7G9RDC6_9ACTN|nr:wax ester/triacylglycerol synthase family O-acyltransferase [Nocardioides mesophilus]QNN53601.1 wax ester/triacylglycerol synthase family O-acyltransferase [Nocardioides mesophilus]
MSERLHTDDMAFLVTESASTPMHNATLDVFEPPRDGFDYDTLLRLIADRIAFVPRYRQRIAPVPAHLGNPVWVDDDDFDLTFHVRRSALPRPGSMDQLRDLTARIVSRRLDRHRPLWEVYLIEGLEGGRFAILSKAHQVLVDGVSIDLGQVLLDVDDKPRETVQDNWAPRPVPSPPSLAVRAVLESVRDPRVAVATAGSNVRGLLRSAGSFRSRAREAAGTLSGGRAAPDSPINVALSEQRRFATVRTDLDDYRTVRREHGGTVNDVILATVTGALRFWLMTRAEPVHSSRSLRALVPMSVIDSDLEPTALGSQVAGHLLSLPIGEPSPVVRLHQVSYALKAHKETGHAVAADRLTGVAGFAPTTFHALGARLAASEARRNFNLVVTNVPGPQFPLYAAGAQMLQSYPVPPLLPDHALAIGVTSYDGGIYFGLTADRDAVPDLEVLAQCVEEALEELVDSSSEARERAPRGKKAPPEKPAAKKTGKRP